MNPNPRNSIPIHSQLSNSSISMDPDDPLDLFSRRHRSLLISSHAQPNGHQEAMKFGRSGVDDLLSSELGKHDYDWLLTPPGTPLTSSLEAGEQQLATRAPKSSSNVRASSTTKTSRLSVSQSENGHSNKPARSISAMRPSISSTHSSNYLSNNNRTSILNTSTASVTSRPSTPSNRSTTATSRSSTLTSRPVSSRPSTPTRTRPPPTSPADKPKPMHGSRPSTPNGRPQLPTSLNSNSNTLAPRPSSRPSTPTRRTPSSVSWSTTTSKPSSRPSSPAARPRTPVQPINIPDFPLDVPPNLKTKLPERPASAGRTRPGIALTTRTTTPSTEVTPLSSNRRSSSPIVTRGRLPESSPKSQSHSNGYETTPPDFHKSMKPTRTPVSYSDQTTGFGRSLSKKSLDMAYKHMDIRQNIGGGIRSTSIFPHSIRSSTKGRAYSKSDQTAHTANNAVHMHQNFNGTVTEDCYEAISENGNRDPYGSYRYDAILLKEDSKSMNWLHSIDGKSDQSPEFDHRFEPLPEPFSPL
ncbi:mucin-5AC-like [Dioscorea cayenensis subsp. rotundata]|uniref:Mucin-5AC-like n=1 Tax=Dioscorea cayennensis subsp. rotundata TaxID=55577 RepID=A0AB40C8J1_DIOCR|nr:mucin-5AC-like [Dioscorea cayenensis subsp. rotundata]